MSPSPEACFPAGSLQPGKLPRPLTRGEVRACPRRRRACFPAGSLQPGKLPRPLTRGEVRACPPSPEACFPAGSLQPGKLPRPLTRGEVRACPRRRRACFPAGSLQPGKLPRPLTRGEVRACPRRRRACFHASAGPAVRRGGGRCWRSLRGLVDAETCAIPDGKPVWANGAGTIRVRSRRRQPNAQCAASRRQAACRPAGGRRCAEPTFRSRRPASAGAAARCRPERAPHGGKALAVDSRLQRRRRVQRLFRRTLVVACSSRPGHRMSGCRCCRTGRSSCRCIE